MPAVPIMQLEYLWLFSLQLLLLSLSFCFSFGHLSTLGTPNSPLPPPFLFPTLRPPRSHYGMSDLRKHGGCSYTFDVLRKLRVRASSAVISMTSNRPDFRSSTSPTM